MRKIMIPALCLLLGACSLPAAVSKGFSDISAQHQENQERRQAEAEKREKYAADTFTNNAIVAFVKGNLDDAKGYAEQALQENPRDAYAMMIMAVVNDIMGIQSKAGFYYQEIIDTRNMGLTTLGSFQIYPPKSLYEAATNRLKVIDLQQAPFIIRTVEGEPPTFDIKSRYQAAVVKTAQEPSVLKDGEALFSDSEKHIISRFLTLKALAEKGYITKDEFLARRNANIGGLLPQTKPRAARIITAPVPTTASITDRFDSMRRAYELKAINSREYVAERDTILEALLPLASVEKMAQVPPPADLLAGADEVRKLEILRSMDLITEAEMKAERAEIERLLKFGNQVPLADVKPAAQDGGMKPLVAPTQINKKPAPAKK